MREEPVLGPKAGVPGPNKRRRGRLPGKKATALPRSNQVPGVRPQKNKETGSAHSAGVPASNKRPRGRPPKRATEEAAPRAPRWRGRPPGSGAARAAAATTLSNSSARNTIAEDSKDGQHATVPPPKTRKPRDQPRKLPADKDIGAAGTEPGSLCTTDHKSPGGSGHYPPERKKPRTSPTPKAAAMLASAGTVGPAQCPPTDGLLGVAMAAAKPHAAAKQANGAPGAPGDAVKPKRDPGRPRKRFLLAKPLAGKELALVTGAGIATQTDAKLQPAPTEPPEQAIGAQLESGAKKVGAKRAVSPEHGQQGLFAASIAASSGATEQRRTSRCAPLFVNIIRYRYSFKTCPLAHRRYCTPQACKHSL